MKCGNCKGEHQTVAEVRRCYGQKRRTPVPEKFNGATPRQVAFIRDLLGQVEMAEEDLAVPISDMTFDVASETITLLKERKTEGKVANLTPTFLGELVPQGTYTVVFDSESDDRVTIRFRVPTMGKWAGTQLVEYLWGPDNTTDFRRFANRTDDGYRVWNQYREDGRLTKAVEAMVNADEENRAGAGFLYSLRSSNCWRCNRLLTVPTSIHRGLGPDCAEQLGVA